MNSHGGSISPPPSRKRKLSDLSSDESKAALPTEPYSSPSMPLTSNTRLLRIYSWNINGIAPFLQNRLSQFVKPKTSNQLHSHVNNSLRSFLKRHNWPQVVHLQEVKISPSDEKTQRSVERAVNASENGIGDGPSYTVKFCLPKDRHNATGFGRKVYGVATIIRDDFLEREDVMTREVEWDSEGRVLVLETRSKLALFNIYAVNGTTYAYRDSSTGDVTGTRHDRKLAFHRLLMDECKNLESKGYRVILAGDMNVAPSRIDGHPNLRTKPEQHAKNRADFNAKFLANRPTGLGMIDSFRHVHKNDQKYTWFPRNKPWKSCCDRVDLILVSKSLVESDGALEEADILMSEFDRGPSDHVPLYISLDAAGLQEISLF